MIVNTTTLGKSIIQEAEKLLKTTCLEKTARPGNDGPCIKKLVSELSPAYASNNGTKVPYCAITVSVILNRAFAKFGEDNPLQSASATGLKDLAKKYKIRIDKNPAPGAVMIAKSGLAREGSTSGFHAGLVWYLKGKDIVTIEGNTSGYLLKNDCIKKAPIDGVVFKQRPAKAVPYFLHIEDYLGNDLVSTEVNLPGMAGLGAVNQETCVLNLETDSKFPDKTPDYLFYKERGIVDYLPFAILGIAVGFIGYKVINNYKG